MDINTPRGQQTLIEEQAAADLMESMWKRVRYIHTDKSSTSKLDAFLVRDNRTVAAVLTSCRRECSLSTFRFTWNDEWILTYRKVQLGAWLCKHIMIPLYGFLYIVDVKKLVVQKLYDPARDAPWVAKIRVNRTWTQATVNGGEALRWNGYIKIGGYPAGDRPFLFDGDVVTRLP